VNALDDPNVALYFAFGSNMSSERMRARIASARSVGRGQLEGYRFVCNKTGRDGSAKANLMRALGDKVWGVVYQFERTELARLDAFEGGYQRVVLGVHTEVSVLACETYLSDRVTETQMSYDWYKRHMVDGAEEHGLPRAWVAMLRELPERMKIER